MTLSQIIYRYIARRQPARQVAYPNFSQVRSVLIIYESDWQERNQPIRAIAKQLRDQGKRVTLWGYVKKDHPTSPILPDSRVLGTKDYTLWGTPQRPVLQDLQSTHYDLLIDLTTTPLLPLQYISLQAQAAFKIGARDAHLNDMVIQVAPASTAEYLFREIIHYLQLIKSAD